MPERTWETPGPVRLDLEIPFGRVEIDTAEGETTHVSLEGSDSMTQELVENARLELREHGGGQEVIVEVRQRGFFLSFGRGPEIRLRVTCPPGADANIRTKSADVRARGAYGSFEVKTASGDVSVEEVLSDARMKTASGDLAITTVGGQTQVQTASGDVALQRVDGDVTAQLVSGDIWIRDAGSSVHINTVSGDQRVEAVQEGSVEANAVSGDILIGVRRGSRFYVDANTISGSTSSELELSDAPESGDASEEDADAPMVEVRAKTVSGDISIVRAPAPARKLPAG
jgi:DUF4097 and DUF4098 domain-containing protein YvlB